MNQKGVLLAALAFGATLLIHLGGGDIWWHLRTGQWILETGTIPRIDPFSHTAPGPWTYTDAGAQVIYALTFALSGVAGLVVLHALIGTTWIWFVGRLGQLEFGSSVALLGILGATVHSACAPKPQLFTYLFFTVALSLVIRAKDNPRVLLWMPILCLPWGWLHRGGILAIALLLAVVASWIWAARKRRDVQIACLSAALSLGALILNPGGTDYLASAFDLASRASFQNHLADWQPASFELILKRHPAFLALVCFWVVGQIKSRLDLSPVLLIAVGMAYLTMNSIRFLPLLAVSLVPTAALGLQFMIDKAQSTVRPSLITGLGTVCGLAILMAHVSQNIPLHRFSLSVDRLNTPVDAAEFVKTTRPPGKMWNSFDLGGYLLFRLAPEIPVSIDGRNDTVYENSQFKEAIDAETNPERFEQLVETLKIGFIVQRYRGPGDPAFAFLEKNTAWSLVYWDDVAFVWVRNNLGPEFTRYAQRWRLDPIRPRLTLRRLMSDPRVGQDVALRTSLKAQVRRAPNALISHVLWGLYSRAIGHFEAYEQERIWVNTRAEAWGLPMRLPALKRIAISK